MLVSLSLLLIWLVSEAWSFLNVAPSWIGVKMCNKKLYWLYCIASRMDDPTCAGAKWGVLQFCALVAPLHLEIIWGVWCLEIEILPAHRGNNGCGEGQVLCLHSYRVCLDLGFEACKQNRSLDMIASSRVAQVGACLVAALGCRTSGRKTTVCSLFYCPNISFSFRIMTLTSSRIVCDWKQRSLVKK